jgi:hypothetical protein
MSAIRGNLLLWRCSTPNEEIQARLEVQQDLKADCVKRRRQPNPGHKDCRLVCCLLLPVVNKIDETCVVINFMGVKPVLAHYPY